MKATKTKSGRWTVLAFVGRDADGHKIQKRFTGNDRRAVLQAAAEYADEHRQAEGVRFGDAAESVATKSTLSPTTQRSYQSILRTIKERYPDLYDTPIPLISADDLQSVLDSYGEDHSAKTVRNWHGFMCAVYRTQRIRMPIVDLPPREAIEYHIPTDFEVKLALQRALSAGEVELWVCISLAAFGPLRAGEIAALRCEDIDFAAGTIHVSHSMARTPEGLWVLKAPKTRTSDRVILMPQEVMDTIRRQGYVTHWNPQQIYEHFCSLLRKAGIRHFRFHDLRHYCASYLHAKGYPDIYIQARTGHASDQVLRQVYTHVLTDEQAEISKRMLNDFQNLMS